MSSLLNPFLKMPNGFDESEIDIGRAAGPLGATFIEVVIAAVFVVAVALASVVDDDDVVIVATADAVASGGAAVTPIPIPISIPFHAPIGGTDDC